MGDIVLIDEKINDLQNLTKRKISYQDIADVFNVTRSAIQNRVARKVPLKEFEESMLDEAFGVIITKEHNMTQDDILLDYYPEVFGSCGTGVFELSQTKEQLIVPKKAFFTRYSTNKKYSVINARGNSMQPYIYDGDRLIVEHWEGEQIIDNRPYVFCYDNEIFIKRLAKNVNQLIISSDNHDYNKIVLQNDDLNKVQVIGQIVGLMRDLR